MGSTLSKKQKQGLILFGIGTVFLIGGLYIDDKLKIELKNQQQKLDSNDKGQEDIQQTEISSNHDIQLQQIKEQIQVEYTGDKLSFDTIGQILEKSIDLCKKEYIQITLGNRKQRRDARTQSNSQLYQQLVLQYNEQVENLLEQKKIKLFTSLSISEEVFQESVMFLMDQGYFQQFFIIQATIKQKIKEAIPSTKILSLEQLKQILDYQVQIITNKPIDLASMIQTLSNNQETQQLIPLAVNTILADYCFEKFQIEEEDLIKMMQNPENYADQKMQKLMNQLEQAMYQLMGAIA
ncbi:unnamed protein product [Paramecium sonneborni]|uniref:Transmembrane protein n=1 Tax=Paramecium sonneborni TaxID=65129 RepID=A0A8S1MII4_9CILI|nr:unnamed protein product [Paramecium sonneborni]